MMIFGSSFVPLRSSFVNSPSGSSSGILLLVLEVLLPHWGKGLLGNIIAGISVDQAGHFIGTTWDY